MADLNVFALTNQELRADEKKSQKSQPKSIKESIKRRAKKRVPFSIPANKLKFESLSMFKEDEGESDVTADYTPEDDVVLVIDPEMDEVPEDTEEAESAAEELIGNHVCKCSICGANYVTDAEITEELEIEDEECPVCGETGDQIVVGVITPMEELSTEDEEDIEGDDIESEDEGEEDFDFGDFDDEEPADDEGEEAEDEDDEDFGESFRRPRMRKEAAKRPLPRKRVRNESKVARRLAARKPSRQPYAFDEAVFNRMLTQFAKENYANVRAIRITEGTLRGSKISLSGEVTTTKGSRMPIKFVAENFKPGKVVVISFKEIGPFTESIANDKPSFIVECKVSGSVITPMTLKYSYKTKNAGIRESKATYSVTGKILSESVRRPARRAKRSK